MLKEIIFEMEDSTTSPRNYREEINRLNQEERELRNSNDPLKNEKLRIINLKKQLLVAEESLRAKEKNVPATESKNISNDDLIEERAIRQFKNINGKLVKKYRCLDGKKKGKLVSSPSDCAKRKDPKKVRHGKKVMRKKKGIIVKKTQLSKRRAISKILQRLNKKMKNI